MTRIKTIEFWLIALPFLFIAAVVAAGFDQVTSAGGVIPALAVVWMILAIFWMIREILRRFAN